MSKLEILQSIGLSDSKASETLKNANLTQRIEDLIELTKKNLGSDTKISKSMGTVLYTLATTNLTSDVKLQFLIRRIASGLLTSTAQLKAALEFFKTNASDNIDEEKFNFATGIGVTYSESHIDQVIDKYIDQNKSKILVQREKFNISIVLGQVLSELKWLNVSQTKDHINSKITSFLETTEHTEILQPCKEKIKNVEKNLTFKSLMEQINPNKIYRSGEASKFHKPGHNYETDGYVVTSDTMRLMKEHINKYGDQIRTRFPPEPNGILHIGHAKAINFNFGYAKAHNGITYLRYDDTNPEKEEERFFIGIQDMVHWLGFEPYQITHASDNFDKLYDYALILIKKNFAYVCHQQQSEIQGKNVPLSPWRNRPIEESLQLFKDMKAGKIEEGKATLRLKFTMDDGKVDPVAYRIKFVPHHRTKDKWCIYPTYDYTHPLCDSIEGITHSLCTKEFQSHRSIYYWLCNAVGVYCPVQWEYGRLNMNYTVVSKRKIAKLISNNIVQDWDDPRLFTLSGLQRRGIPYTAINYFCSKIGVTMADGTINPDLLDSCTRDVLNLTSKRVMAVLNPIKIVVLNYNADFPASVTVPINPIDSDQGERQISFGSIFYIDSSDFMLKTELNNDYRRLTPTQPVGLKHIGLVIDYRSHKMCDDGKSVSEIQVYAKNLENDSKPKAFIHWVHNPISCRVNIYNNLFMHPNPEDKTQVPDGFLSDINPDSLLVMNNSMIDQGITGAKVHDCFQFERLGYFSVDPDTTPEMMVFNRTVSLKESK